MSSDFISPPDNSHIGFLKRNDVTAGQLSMVLSPDGGSRSSARVRGVILPEVEAVKGKETAKEKAADKKREKEKKDEKEKDKKQKKEMKEKVKKQDKKGEKGQERGQQ